MEVCNDDTLFSMLDRVRFKGRSTNQEEAVRSQLVKVTGGQDAVVCGLDVAKCGVDLISS